MEIRFKIDDDFMEALKKNLKGNSNKRITEDALTLLNWAANEVKQGRVILSTDEKGEVVKRLAMPTLDKLAIKET